MASLQHKTPGVYISEPDSFPPAIVGVDTAVPAFIGYTEKAMNGVKHLDKTPQRIQSMAEFIQYFGGAYPESYYLLKADAKVPAADQLVGSVSLVQGGAQYQLVQGGDITYNLYNAMQLFYANGGGDCYIVSCGTYGAAISDGDIADALDAVANVVGPTMLVVPDAVLLSGIDAFNKVVVKMLGQCQSRQDRIALLDVYGARDVQSDSDLQDKVSAFRSGLAGASPQALRYGAAYFPFLKTSIVSSTDLTVQAFAGAKVADFKAALTEAVNALYTAGDPRIAVIGGYIAKIGATVPDTLATQQTPVSQRPGNQLTHKELTDLLVANIPPLSELFAHVAESQNTLPPSAAIAGVISAVDRERGVWFAPANRGIATLIAPTYAITDHQQEDLNAPTEGKAINAIRTFPRGSLIWGARTLDANSNDWKYIQVRRTMIYVEQSVKTALNAFVFEPNTASTWTTVTSMIESFLHGLWAAGGLMGATPAQAFSVQCGLGSTMTADDILAGNMIVQIVLQMVHPAEFIELVFKQQMLDA